MSNKKCPEKISIPFTGSREALVTILAHQYGRYERGEIRTLLENAYADEVWTDEELLKIFEVAFFDAPYVYVIRKKDGQRGTVLFLDTPRFYFSFVAETHDEQ
jgi:hypothetical protein